MKTAIQTLVFALALTLLTACGGGNNGNISHDAAISKFVAYAESNGTSEEPTLQDYLDAGVTGVTEDNLDEINEVVENLTEEEVDTTGEIQDLADRLGIVVDTTAPVFTSAASATVAENQTAAITLVATDTSAITYSISGGDSASFSVNSSTGVVTFSTAPDYETKTSYTFTATATDAAGNATTQDVTITILNDACTGGDVISHLGTDYCAVTSPYTGKVWLDRNLGATMVCSKSRDDADAGFTDATYTADQGSCFGDYYQWGRNFDGHENNESSTTAIQATQIDPVQSEVEGKFITSGDTNDYDWAKAIDSNGSTRQANWSKTDGSSVCPVGFRVPTIDELKAELFDTDSSEIADRDDAFNSFLKLPTAGFRYGYGSGSLEGQGTWGDVWSSSVDGAYSYDVGFSSNLADWYHVNRAYGQSVRCLRD